MEEIYGVEFIGVGRFVVFYVFVMGLFCYCVFWNGGVYFKKEVMLEIFLFERGISFRNEGEFERCCIVGFFYVFF